MIGLHMRACFHISSRIPSAIISFRDVTIYNQNKQCRGESAITLAEVRFLMRQEEPFAKDDDDTIIVFFYRKYLC